MLVWLLAIEILGLMALPFTFTLFRRLPDRGLVLSKLLGLLVSSYVLWLLGLTQLIPNSRYTIIAILVVLALASFLVMRRKLAEITSFLRREWLPLLTAELVFLGLYLLWLSVVANSPAINHTEKPMDFAFLNAILTSTHFPPEDPWLAGHSISYYYFGHLMMAFLTKLTAIPSNISYNLSIALIPAMVGAAAFSLVFNLVRLAGAKVKTSILIALVAPVLILLIGNLEGILELVHARGWGSDGFWGWVSIKGLESAQAGDPSVFPRQHWWWWHATRVIDTVVDGRSLDYTITEFPFFSFFLGDLHAHVSALPFVILSLALGLNLFVSDEKLGLGWLRRYPWEVLAITLSLGALAFINIWDFPLAAAIFVALVLVKGYGDWGGRVQAALLSSATLLIPVLVGAVVLFIPFYLTLSSQASGALPLRDPGTRPFFFFLIWGLFLVLSGSFLLRQLLTVPGLSGRYPGTLSMVLVITVLPFLLWAGIELGVSPFDDGVRDGLLTIGGRLAKLLPALAIVAVALYSALLRVGHSGQRATAFSLICLAMAFYLLMGAELFYVSDLFGNRMNTVFKLHYQAWLLLGLASAYGLYYWRTLPMPTLAGPAGRGAERLLTSVKVPWRVVGKGLRYGWVGVVVVLFAASLYYPLGAGLDGSRSARGSSTFDGLAFLQRGNSSEYEAIVWLRDEAPRGRIVEAVGNDYSDFGRISASTGLPTVLGWKGHERQWRGSTRPFRGREEQVAQIYTSGDPDQVRDLLETYDIRYVYLGARERREYGDSSSFEKFSSFLQPVFESDDVVVYERLHQGGRDIVEEADGIAG